MAQRAILALADGRVFHGSLLGVSGSSRGEIVFNTSMTGYQEILTDPSYAEQIITFTYPHIGNVGINQEDNESSRIWAKGLVIRELTPITSNWRAKQDFSAWLIEQNVIGITHIDTRALTRHIAQKGFMNACISSELSESEAVQQAMKFPGMVGLDLTERVSTKKIYVKLPAHSPDFHVVAYDFGIKQAIIDCLLAVKCKVTVVPAKTPVEQVMAFNPDGILLSNGPGDPAAATDAITYTRQFLAMKLPILGICLGCQLLGLAAGGRTVKMKFGHHGANQPVMNELSGSVAITSQNHGFAIADESLPKNWEVTHRSLFDGSIQGIRHLEVPAMGFQGHPEASPGPHDMYAIFREFVHLMQVRNGKGHEKSSGRLKLNEF